MVLVVVLVVVHGLTARECEGLGKKVNDWKVPSVSQNDQTVRLGRY